MNSAIADTGPPLHLHQIGYIRLLEMFKAVIISGQVKEELEKVGIWHSLKQEGKLHLQEEPVNDSEIANEQDRWTGYKLQKADLSVLVLVSRIMDTLTLTDDLELRRAIESLGRLAVGSVGVLIRGYRERKLNKDELSGCVDMLFDDSSLYLSRAFRVRVLKLIEELEGEKKG